MLQAAGATIQFFESVFLLFSFFQSGVWFLIMRCPGFYFISFFFNCSRFFRHSGEAKIMVYTDYKLFQQTTSRTPEFQKAFGNIFFVTTTDARKLIPGGLKIEKTTFTGLTFSVRKDTETGKYITNSWCRIFFLRS